MVSDRGADAGGADGDAPEATDARVLVLFEGAANRRHVADCLDPTYDVVTGRTVDCVDSTVDCCLVDSAAFARHHEELPTADEDAPENPPLLLVVDPDVLERSERRVWGYVDEVITTPVAKAELIARVSALADRHALVREVARSEARFRTLFETAPDPVLVVGADGALAAMNEAFCEATGVDREDCLGRVLSALPVFPAQSGARLRTAISEAPTETPVQVSYRAPEGAVRFADAGVERLATDDGGQYVVVLRDVTERVHRTRELERQNDRLEEFAQVLAHELRNPLNIAGGRLELARAGGPDVEEHLQRVREAHERIERMIEELLGLSRQGNVVGETATENLESVVRSAWEETPTADATLVVECDGQSLTADRERVRDVLRNLFRNAVEHGRSDATIRVGALTSDAGFYVEDDGPGIPEAERESVLEPGYTTTESGTGFGLAIVDQIAAAHDWDVAVTSGSEGGARFEITGTAAASRDT